MASRKTELKKHLAYLESRRSGLEKALDIIESHEDPAVARQILKDTIAGSNKSVQETNAEIATIEQKEQEEKDRKAAEKKLQEDNRRKNVY